MVEDRRNLWKMTAIGVVVAAVTAVVTGMVVANRTGVGTDTSVVAPAASPPAPAEPRGAQVQSPAPAATGAAPGAVPKATPSQSAIAECNRVASMQRGPQQESRDKWGNIIKGGGIGAVGGAAAGAIGGAIADGGSGAGKGALIGGGIGAGAGSLYGIYKNKQHDEAYRSAYQGCMRAKGYTG